MKIFNENTMSKSLSTSIGISDILINIINKKYDCVSDLNSLKVTLDSVGFEYDKMIPIVNEIIADEHNHIGQLQELISLISIEAKEVDNGKQITIDTIDNNL